MILRVFNRESFKSSLLEQEKLFTKKIGLLLLPFQNKFSKMHIYTYIYIYIYIYIYTYILYVFKSKCLLSAEFKSNPSSARWAMSTLWLLMKINYSCWQNLFNVVAVLFSFTIEFRPGLLLVNKPICLAVYCDLCNLSSHEYSLL